MDQFKDLYSVISPNVNVIDQGVEIQVTDWVKTGPLHAAYFTVVCLSCRKLRRLIYIC
jgi:hypothetical protein